MKKIEAYVSKDFLNSFADAFLNTRDKYDDESDRLFNKYSTIKKLFRDSELIIDIQREELLEIFKTSDVKSMFLKSILKENFSSLIPYNLVLKLKEKDGKIFFDSLEDNFPYRVFFLDDTFVDKKISQYERYYGYKFIKVEGIKNLRISEDYQVGLKNLDLSYIQDVFKYFNSILIIDPYALKSKERLLDLIENILPSKPKSIIYMDLIIPRVDVPSDLERFVLEIKELEADFDLTIDLKIHELSKDKMHDRYYITNNVIVNFGHGLEFQSDNKDSNVRIESIFSSTDNRSYMEIIFDKLSFYKKVFGVELGNNPIWKILNESNG